MPQILCRFQELAPKARVTFHDLGQTGMIAGLRSRSLHAALTLRPPAGEVRGLKFDTIRSYRHGIICAAGSPWDGMASLNPATLLDIPLVGYQMEDIPEYYKLISKCLGISETSLRIRQQCDGVVSLIAAVESGLGPAVVGEFIKPVAGNRVRFVPFPPRTINAEVGILYRQSGLSDRGKVFVEACRLSS